MFKWWIVKYYSLLKLQPYLTIIREHLTTKERLNSQYNVRLRLEGFKWIYMVVYGQWIPKYYFYWLTTLTIKKIRYNYIFKKYSSDIMNIVLCKCIIFFKQQCLRISQYTLHWHTFRINICSLHSYINKTLLFWGNEAQRKLTEKKLVDVELLVFSFEGRSSEFQK